MTVGLGTSAIGGLYEELDDDAARATLEAAWAAGTRYFDTAPHYGAGVAERRLGAFLRELPRAEFTVSTKVGRLLRSGERVRDYTADGVYVPASTGSTDLDCVLVAGRYTLLDRTAEAELLPACVTRGVDVVVGGVFNSGVLASPGPDAHFDYLPVPPEIRARVDALAAACARHGVALPAAAVQFPLRHKAVTSIVIGARPQAEVEQNAAHLATAIPDALWAELTCAVRRAFVPCRRSGGGGSDLRRGAPLHTIADSYTYTAEDQPERTADLIRTWSTQRGLPVTSQPPADGGQNRPRHGR